jgi:hypothetical protein
MIGAAVADSPGGPFADIKSGPVFDDGYMNIDAHVFVDDDGSKYLYYSRDCSQNVINGKRTSQIFCAKLGEDMASIVSEPVLCITPDEKWEFRSVDPLWNEGAEVMKHDGKYYLMYSTNFFGSRYYALGYAVSDRPDGGFVKPEGNPILRAGAYEGISGPGHHSFVKSLDEREWVCIYHSHTDPKAGGGNRQANLSTMGFTPDGILYMNGPHIGLQPRPSSDGHRDLILNEPVKVNGQINGPAGVLTDHRFAVHPEQDELIWRPDGDTAEIEISLSSPETVKSVVLYRDPGQKDGYPEITLTLDGTDAE